MSALSRVDSYFAIFAAWLALKMCWKPPPHKAAGRKQTQMLLLHILLFKVVMKEKEILRLQQIIWQMVVPGLLTQQ